MTASAAASGAATPVMSLETVTRDYRQGDETVHALRSTDLTLRAGELVGILGPSGSGKSTLLTIMGGLRTPSSGTVTISGQPFSSLPEKQRARLRRDHLLHPLGITKRAHAYPSELSGGERQRAAIAVALYHDPDIILADEPTASLDTRRAQDVAHLLADQTHELGKATVMVTHDKRLLPVCDRVLAMHDGVLTEQDAPKDSEGQSGSRDDR